MAGSGKNSGRSSSGATDLIERISTGIDKRGNKPDRGKSMHKGVKAGKNIASLEKGKWSSLIDYKADILGK